MSFGISARSHLSVPAIFAMAWMVCFSAAAQYSYQFTNLGAQLNLPPDGLNSTSLAVNDTGQVVFTYWAQIPQIYGTFIYEGGILTDLNLAYGIPATGGAVVGISNSGRMAAYYNTSNGEAHSYVIDSNGFRDLADFGLASTWTVPTGVSDSGVIVGVASGVNSSVQGYYFDGQSLTYLSRPSVLPVAMNVHGEIVGSFMADGGAFSQIESRAFLYSNGVYTNLGALPGAFWESGASAINDSGLIVGYSTNNAGKIRAVTFQGGGVQDLGTLGGTSSSASDVNNEGFIIGGSFDSSGAARATLWLENNVYDLNTLTQGLDGYTLESAGDISNTGYIVGQAFNGTTYTAYLLTPIAPVPEPAGMILLACGGVMSLMTRRRRTMQVK